MREVVIITHDQLRQTAKELNKMSRAERMVPAHMRGITMEELLELDMSHLPETRVIDGGVYQKLNVNVNEREEFYICWVPDSSRHPMMAWGTEDDAADCAKYLIQKHQVSRVFICKAVRCIKPQVPVDSVQLMPRGKTDEIDSPAD